MKKLLSLLMVGSLLFVFACGGGGKYGDVKDVMEEYGSVMEKFADRLDGAENADDVVAALEECSTAMKRLVPKFKEFKDKYPNINSEPPEELKPVMEKFMKSMAKFQTVMPKIAKFATDPKVVEAQKKFMEAMQGAK